MSATDIATAEREADDARAAVEDAEQSIRTSRRKILVEILGRRQHAELTAGEAHDRAERERDEARREALKALGAEIDAAAPTANAAIADVLSEVAAATGKARAAAAEWDSSGRTRGRCADTRSARTRARRCAPTRRGSRRRTAHRQARNDSPADGRPPARIRTIPRHRRRRRERPGRGPADPDGTAAAAGSSLLPRSRRPDHPRSPP